MIGRSYSIGRRVERHTGGGGRMKPTNFSETVFGIFMLLAILFILGSCITPFVGD